MDNPLSATDPSGFETRFGWAVAWDRGWFQQHAYLADRDGNFIKDVGDKWVADDSLAGSLRDFDSTQGNQERSPGNRSDADRGGGGGGGGGGDSSNSSSGQTTPEKNASCGEGGVASFLRGAAAGAAATGTETTDWKAILSGAVIGGGLMWAGEQGKSDLLSGYLGGVSALVLKFPEAQRIPWGQMGQDATREMLGVHVTGATGTFVSIAGSATARNLFLLGLGRAATNPVLKPAFAGTVAYVAADVAIGGVCRLRK
jgi:hypothetical protein